MSALPTGWVVTELGALFGRKRGSALAPAKQPDRRFELYSVPAFKTGRPERPLGAEVGSSKQAVLPGTVLLCRINPRINRVWIVGERSDDPQIASTEWIALRRVEAVAPRFLMYALRTPAARGHLTSSVSGVGGSLMRVRMAAAWQTRVPLAPLPEQHRIVAKIESLFAELDEGIAALKRAEANLERYRASVLKSAVEGRLTERWRRENPPEETGEELLGRILAERRKCWEAEQLAKFAAKGRKPPKNWKKKYKEPVRPATTGLPRLPEGWCWATVDQMAAVTGGLTKNPARNRLPVRYPYLRVANVYADELRLDDVRTIGVSESELDRVILRPGDLLVVEGNGSANQIGRVAQWQGDVAPCCHQNHLIKVRSSSAACRSRWMLLWLLSPLGRRTVLAVASSTSGLHTLSLSKVRALPVPLAPMQEQACAVSVADSLADVARVVQAQIEAETGINASRLRQSILKRAFEGGLVPQDPADEPASVLLERIRAEREAKRKRSKRRRAKPRRQPKSRVP